MAITIEGKADESFDGRVSVALQSALERIAADERTGAIVRAESLSAALPPPWRTGLAHLGDLRYQLLTSIAGTLAWAREIGATRAVFAVHEFVTDYSRDEKHAQNASDLNLFVERLSDGVICNLSAGVLVGPVRVHGNGRIPSLPLYLGKAVRKNADSALRTGPVWAGYPPCFAQGLATKWYVYVLRSEVDSTHLRRHYV